MKNRMKVLSLSLGAGMAAILVFACCNTASAQGYYGGYGGGYHGGSYRVNRVSVHVDRGYCGDYYRDYYGGYDRCYSRPVVVVPSYPSYSRHGYHGHYGHHGHGYRPQGPPHHSHGHHPGHHPGPRPRR